MRSSRISLVIAGSVAVVGVAGSPAWAMRPVPVDQRGQSAPVVVQVAPAAGVDTRGMTLGRRVPPLQGGQPGAVLGRAELDARGMVLGRRVAPVVR